MMTKTVIAWLFIIIGTLLGVVFLTLVVSLYKDYLRCKFGETCIEMLIGPAIFSLFSTPCWALSSLGVFLLGDTIKKSIRMISYSFCALMFVGACAFLTVL